MPDKKLAKATKDEIARLARKHALKNAFDYGKAKAGPVLNKVFAELPDSKKAINEAIKIVNKVVREVNALPKEELRAELSKHVFPEKKQRIGLPDLPWVKSGMQVNTRFAPNPSGFLHIGHSKVAILCDEYSKRYDGKFYVRFDDTDPRTKKPVLSAYDSIIEDLIWLGCSIAKVLKQSERMPIYYRYAEELIKSGKAYVCTCGKEKMQENRRRGVACGCRKDSPSDSITNWEKMRTKYAEGEAVLRLKTDLHHPNSSVRDWVMFRIIDEPHPIVGTKYRVWPLYNFASAIDDHEMQINLIIRGKEHEINQIKQAFLYDIFSWQMPHVLEVGILKVKGELAHKSDIREAIKTGKLTGWDDPRAPTIKGFRNRGLNPQAIREYMIASGIGKSDSYLDTQKLASFGRKVNKQ